MEWRYVSETGNEPKEKTDYTAVWGKEMAQLITSEMSCDDQSITAIFGQKNDTLGSIVHT